MFRPKGHLDGSWAISRAALDTFLYFCLALEENTKSEFLVQIRAIIVSFGFNNQTIDFGRGSVQLPTTNRLNSQLTTYTLQMRKIRLILGKGRLIIKVSSTTL